MKVSNKEILDANEALGKLMQEKLPVMVSWNIAKLVGKVKEPVKAIDTVRKGLISKYEITFEKAENGVTVNSKQEDGAQKFYDEVEELAKQEIELVFDTIKLPQKVSATCDKCHHNMDKPLEIEPSILLALEKFVNIE